MTWSNNELYRRIVIKDVQRFEALINLVKFGGVHGTTVESQTRPIDRSP
jgi:hypothetical protein